MKIKLTILSLALALGLSHSFAGQSDANLANAESISLPQPLKMIPPRLSDFHYGSEVVLEFTVQKDGTVADIKPVKYYWQIEQVEVASKMETVLEQWSFVPGTNASGQAVPTRVQMPVIVSSEGISIEGYRMVDDANIAQSESEVGSSVVGG